MELRVDGMGHTYWLISPQPDTGWVRAIRYDGKGKVIDCIDHAPRQILKPGQPCHIILNNPKLAAGQPMAQALTVAAEYVLEHERS